MFFKDSPLLAGLSQVFAGLTFVTVVAGLTWQIGSKSCDDGVDALEERLRTCDLTTEIGAGELLESLKTASNELAANLIILEELSSLRTENNSLQTQVQTLDGTIANLQAQRSVLQDQLDAKVQELEKLVLRDERFRLNKSEAKTFGAYDLSLGLVSLSSVDIKVVFNNETKTMRIGEILTATIDDRICTVILEEFNYLDDYAGFRFVLKDEQERASP